MDCCGGCCIDIGHLAEEPRKKGPDFRPIVCAKCGREIRTDIPGKTMCFECEKSRA